MTRRIVSIALGGLLALALMPAMARSVPPTTPPPSPVMPTCEVLRISIEAAAAEDKEVTEERAAWVTAALADCPGLRESLSAAAQAYLDANGI